MFGLFKWVEDLVSNVISQVLQQVNIIQEAVTSPLRGLVNQVMAGMWKGEGANRFVQEMTSEVIPMLVNIMGFNTNFANAIKKSQDRMQQAVHQATSQAQSLFDVFNRVF
jgi:hypothetical protein